MNKRQGSFLLIPVLCLSVFSLQASSSLAAKDTSVIELQSTDADESEWWGAIKKHFENKFFNNINATAEQRAKLAAMIDQTIVENKRVREDCRQKTIALIDSFGRENVDEEQIRQQIADLRKSHNELMDRRIDLILKARAVMTAEQRKIVAERTRQRLTKLLNAPLLHS